MRSTSTTAPTGAFRPRSRRVALAAAALVLGLSACGSDPADTASTGETPAVTTPGTTPGTAAPTATDAGTTVPTDGPAVIEVAADPTASPTGAALPASDPIAEGEMDTSTKMIAAGIEFIFDGTAQDLTAPASSWYFATGDRPSDEVVKELAAHFGVEGDVVERSPETGGGVVIGPDDYTAPSFNVGTDALQSWWYSAPDAGLSAPTDCSYFPPGDPAADPETADLPLCEEPEPPQNVPTEAEAEQKTVALMEELGLDPSSFELETYADEWSAAPNAFLVLDGIRTNLSMYFSFGEDGVISWAGGFLATAQRGDDYPRIGVEAAVERLNDPTWLMGDAVDAITTREEEVDTIVTDAAAGAEPSLVPEVTAEPTDPDAPVLVDPMPIDCNPAADCIPQDFEPIVVHLSDPQPALEQLWSPDGTVWLLPAYSFTGDDTGVYSVIAVDSAYLAVDQGEVDPAAPVETEVPATAAPETAPAETSGTPDSDPEETAPVTTLEFPDPQDYVGLAVEEMTRVVADRGWIVRVVREDGEDLVVTEDFRENRLNVAVVDGLVTELVSVG